MPRTAFTLLSFTTFLLFPGFSKILLMQRNGLRGSLLRHSTVITVPQRGERMDCLLEQDRVQRCPCNVAHLLEGEDSKQTDDPQHVNVKFRLIRWI